MKKKEDAAVKAARNDINCNFNSTSAQRQRLIVALKEGPKSTVWLRRELDIMMPAARVFELRHREGFNIHTSRRYELTECGKSHNVAEYVLMPGSWEQGGVSDGR